jgi:ATP-dependent helicase/nuclease subunit B
VPRLFSIPSGVPFLPTLADALLDGRLVDLGTSSLDLGRLTIYLPTRRAGRALTALLAERSGGRAHLAPRIIPLGDLDDLETSHDIGDAFPGSADAKPALPSLERRLILARLVQGWAREVDRDLTGLEEGVPFLVPGSPADAVSLAADLEGLMDALATEGVDWDTLADVVEAEYSRYFRLTLDFVRIAHEHWPAILEQRNASDPARRRNALLDAETTRLLTLKPDDPIVVAGSTGSIPATARLMAAISRLPNGAVVLPGLDPDLDEAAWASVADRAAPLYGHPQFMLARFLDEHCRVGRSDVSTLTPESAYGGEARRRLLSEAFRPADTTDQWAAMPAVARDSLAGQGLAGLALVEAADEREEAVAIAIALRETLATPGATAALVTPDRPLARRVAAELLRWDITVDDTAPPSLADTEAGRLARLAAEAAALDFHPVRVLALLAHPSVTLGLDRERVERGAAALEIGVLRGRAPRSGLDGIAALLETTRADPGRSRPRAALSAADWDLAAEVITRLRVAFAGFAAEREPDALDLVGLAERHADTVAALTAPADASEPPDAPAFDDLARLFDDLASVSVEDGFGRSLEGRFSDYPAFFTALARDRPVRQRSNSSHRRVTILGLLEARLLAVDRVVLGGLDEGVWPPTPSSDAFLNRPMRFALGLTPPERRIGQSAHDFVQALSAPDAVLTRAAKRGGQPAVPSRFLARLRAFAGEAHWGDVVQAGRRYLDLAQALDRPRPTKAIVRPAPQPGPERFPRRLRITEIETLVRDPYAIFARHVLRLDPLDRIALTPGHGDFGDIFHGVVADFATSHPELLPDGAAEIVLQHGLGRFRSIEDEYPALHAMWWPRFERFVPAFLKWEDLRRPTLRALHAERPGILLIDLGGGVAIELRGRADRIEFCRAGKATIIDFKTGAVPSAKEIAVGFSPQLVLEALMLMAGGFHEVAASREAPILHYIKVGGRDGLEIKATDASARGGRAMDEIVMGYRRGLADLLRRYALDGAGYMSRPFAKYAQRYASYDHLARVKEWSLGDGAEDGAEGGTE